jgi:hypothetical protein
MVKPSRTLVIHLKWCHIHKKGHFLGMRPIRKIILPSIQVEHLKACMLEVYKGKSIGFSKNSHVSYNISSNSYREAPSSFFICPCHSPFLFSTGTINISYSQRNNT